MNQFDLKLILIKVRFSSVLERILIKFRFLFGFYFLWRNNSHNQDGLQID